MKKPIIGIIAPRVSESNRPFHCFTKVIDNYARRIINAGGVPIGISFPDGFDTITLDICDGLIFQGASIIDETYIKSVDYALKKEIPVLAICAGVQALAGYEYLKQNDLSLNTLCDEKNYLTAIKGHRLLEAIYLNQIDKVKHAVYLKPDSKLFDTFKRETIDEPSIHNYAILDSLFPNDEGKYFKVTGRAEDGTIEVLESKNPNLWIIGVQFHPEIEDNNQVLFDRLIDEAKRK